MGVAMGTYVFCQPSLKKRKARHSLAKSRPWRGWNPPTGGMESTRSVVTKVEPFWFRAMRLAFARRYEFASQTL